MTDACGHGGVPDRSTVAKWATSDPDGFGKRLQAAREAGYEVTADEILRIAEEPATDNPNVEQRRKARIDARKWLLSKRMPRVYGDRVNLDHSGEIKAPVNREAAVAELASILATAAKRAEAKADE